MDKTSKLFDKWANTGRSEEMEKGHGTTVNQFLDKLNLKTNFRFLDSLLLVNLNIDNLLDEEYISTVGYPEPGRSMNFAVEYEL